MDQVRHPLREWRKSNKVTLAQVSERVGVGPSFLSDIENFHKRPSLSLAAKLESVTGIPAREFAA